MEKTRRLPKNPFWRSVRKNYVLYLMLLLPMIYFIMFKYLPMAGNIIAFRKYVPGKSLFGVEWSGLKYFKMFWKDPSFWNAFKNTFYLSFLMLVFSFPIPIIFALLMNELKVGKFKKFVQTVTIMPHFISVVVVVTMMNNMLSPSTGIINGLIESLGGKPVYFMNEPGWFRPLYIISGIWQSMGWNSIIYMAVLSSADMELYDAAQVDGANRLQQVFHITLPVMVPTICVNLVIFIGNMLNIGYEKILLMYTGVTQSTADVIQTLTYRVGLLNANYSYGTAIGLFQGVVSLILLFTCNYIVNKKFDNGLW